jgi:hypothetical protein
MDELLESLRRQHEVDRAEIHRLDVEVAKLRIERDGLRDRARRLLGHDPELRDAILAGDSRG